jgi:predicted nucleic acid-binding protein
VTVVSDSSPLITLARIGELELLRSFFGEVIIPVEVYDEITVSGQGLPGSDHVRSAGWIRLWPNREIPSYQLETVCAGLGAGERAAITLALFVSADLILLDDKKARFAARKAGLKMAGCVGLLEAGFRRGQIADLRAVYDRLIEQGIRIEESLLRESLRRSYDTSA